MQIHKTITAPCNLATMWQKWTTHQGLLTFFGNDNLIELTPGGAFEIYFLLDNPAGLRGSEGCKVLSFLPNQMFSFSWNAPPHFEQVRASAYKTWVVVLFEQVEPNQTRVLLTHLGWPQDPLWLPVYQYFNQAWNVVLHRLKESCKT